MDGGGPTPSPAGFKASVEAFGSEDVAAHAPRDTKTAKESVHFPEHALTKDSVQEKVHSQKTRALPATAVGKSADLATAGVKHGTEELLEVLTTPQGQKFVRSMAANVVEGYLQSARTDLFKQAAKEGAAAGFNGTMEVTELWLQRYKTELAKFVDPRSPDAGGPLLRWAGVFLTAMAVGSAVLLFSMLLLVWKVILIGAC